eukprot:TRINITY_DN13547_c0_g1_i1.p1 TRINITY_DN13547_c0_g1~~TRINITY_DN13547_c0_g1_i1.p1  ORF type:complete len:666 (-),score=117.19 TRINITY_DN13547_c0_g1_i1:317-2314(-)
MSVQYRPELGSISLMPCFPSDSIFNAHRQPSSDSVDSQASNGGQPGFGAMKFRSQGSPISPLSPQELSLVSDAVYSGSYNSPTFTSNSMSARRVDNGYLQMPPLHHTDVAYHGEMPMPSDNLSVCSPPFHSSMTSQTHLPYGDQTPNSYNGGALIQQHLADSCSTVGQRTQSVAQMLQQLESALLDDDDTGFAESMCGDGGGSAVDPTLAFDIDEILYRSSPSDDNNVEASECSSGVVQYPREQHLRQMSMNNMGHQSHGTLEARKDCVVHEAVVKPSHAMEELVPNKAFFGRNKLEEMLVQCAEAVNNHELELAHELMGQLNQCVSIYGDPTQRLAAYMVEGLVARIASSGRRFYKVLKCKEPPNMDLLSAMQILYEVCPYFKFGYMAANGAIAEAFKDEKRVHIIDFEITVGVQWFTLIQALAARPGGPPHVRLTGVDDPQSQSSSGALDDLGRKLAKLAKNVGVPFEFHGIPKKVTDVQPWELDCREDEALACNFALELHHVPDESVCTSNPRDRLLRMVKSLNPKVVTMVEQELNTNTAPFFPRFLEALSYYTAIFESLDVTLARESKDRVNVEQQCLARDIVNIIACEGTERVERHEVIWKWRARMSMAGFKPYPLSSYVNNTIKTLLESYCDKYRLKEEGGALYLGWLNRALITASAWH